MWTLLAIFIPDAIGVILYFILRDPLMKPCPGCSQVLKSGYTSGPHCGMLLLPTCPNCWPQRGIGLGELPELWNEVAVYRAARGVVAGRAFVAAVFRPPSLRDATLMAH